MKPKPARDISRHIFAALSPSWVLRLKQLRCSGSSGHRLQRLVNTNTTHSHPNTTHEDDWRCVKKGPQSALVAIKAVWDSLLFIHCWGHVGWGQPCMLLIESHWSFSPLLVVQVCFRFFSLSQYKQASFIYPMAAASPILSSFYWNAAGTKQKLLLIGLLQNSGFFAPHFASTCRVFIHAVASHFPCGSSRFHSFFKQRLSW